MKRIKLALLLMLCVLALCACQSKEQQRFQVVTSHGGAQNLYGDQATNVPAADNGFTNNDPYTDFDDGSYDPASEEGNGLGDDGLIDLPVEPADAPEATAAPTIRSEYAGATPVVIDPIDKPTPTPVPPLTFAYQTYDATKLHLSFEAPIGWEVNDVSSDTFILYNPDTSVDYQASLTVRAVSVASQYSENDMVKEVKGMLETIGGSGFTKFSPSNTATRTLLDKSGVYANYTGTTTDGAQVAGRVHVTCINKVLYSVHVTYPQAYTTTYKEQVYDHLRSTITITQ